MSYDLIAGLPLQKKNFEDTKKNRGCRDLEDSSNLALHPISTVLTSNTIPTKQCQKGNKLYCYYGVLLQGVKVALLL